MDAGVEMVSIEMMTPRSCLTYRYTTVLSCTVYVQFTFVSARQTDRQTDTVVVATVETQTETEQKVPK